MALTLVGALGLLSGKRAWGMACAGDQWRRGDPQVVMCPEKSHPQENKEKALLGYTQAVDAWALGVLAYELLVGHPPFERETRTDTYEQIMYRRPHYPSALSEGSRSFIAAALTKVTWHIIATKLLGAKVSGCVTLPSEPRSYHHATLAEAAGAFSIPE